MAPPTPLCIVDRRLTIIPQSVWGCNKRSERLCCCLKLPVQLFNWLTAYAEGYRYEIVPKKRNQEERKNLQYFVNRAVAALREEALYQRGATQKDLFPQGKPWGR